MRDVAFHFNKKTGVPGLADSGLADIVLGGESPTKVILYTTRRDEVPTERDVRNVAATVAMQ